MQNNKILVVGLLCVFGAACQAVVAIEEQAIYANTSSICQEYCSTVVENCTDEHAVYYGATAADQEQVCLGVCTELRAGDRNEPGGNTVACRLAQAVSAEREKQYCPAAGPGGAGECGDDCESYCELYSAFCPGYQIEDCEQRCTALHDTGGFDAKLNHEGDTLQCRLVHTSTASLDPNTHCIHAQLTPTGPCSDPADTVPSCEDYCRVVQVACQDERAVYEFASECLATCAAMDPGETGHTTEDTAGCRLYHAYSALLDPEEHCAHAGPAGDGHCGTGGAPNCEAYCRTLEASCSEVYVQLFADSEGCMDACASWPGAARDSGYSLAVMPADSVQCNLRQAIRAFDETQLCAATVADGSCAP